MADRVFAGRGAHEPEKPSSTAYSFLPSEDLIPLCTAHQASFPLDEIAVGLKEEEKRVARDSGKIIIEAGTRRHKPPPTTTTTAAARISWALKFDLTNLGLSVVRFWAGVR